MSDRTCSIEGCAKPHYGRGWCLMHYRRWTRWGDPLALNDDPTPAVDRFWSKVDKSGTCWVWTAHTDRRGYGRMQRGERGQGVILAHRFSWHLATGIDPGDLCVLHLCDNPPCVNPDHLVLGTRAANVLDMINKGRQSSGRPGSAA